MFGLSAVVTKSLLVVVNNISPATNCVGGKLNLNVSAAVVVVISIS